MVFQQVFIYIYFVSKASHAVNYEGIAIRHLSLMFDTLKQDSNVISKIEASLLGQVQQEVEVCQTLPVGLALGLAHIFLQLLLPCRQLQDRAHLRGQEGPATKVTMQSPCSSAEHSCLRRTSPAKPAASLTLRCEAIFYGKVCLQWALVVQDFDGDQEVVIVDLLHILPSHDDRELLLGLLYHEHVAAGTCATQQCPKGLDAGTALLEGTCGPPHHAVKQQVCHNLAQN